MHKIVANHLRQIGLLLFVIWFLASWICWRNS